MGLLGAALARILINNSRFVERQDAMMEARATARAAMQSMASELHGVGDNGLLGASRDSVTLRVPYAFGMACRFSGGTTIASLMPVDSVTYASAAPEGLAWRTVGGAYTAISPVAVASSGNISQCTADSIRVIPGGKLVAISGPSVNSNSPPSGSLMYLYHTVTYKFAPSVDLPGRRGLWRKAGSAGYEELAAPFDTSAKFAFLFGPYMRVQVRTSISIQASRDSVRGLELRLTGASVTTPPGASRPPRFDLRSRIAFSNKVY
jgi:type II secretory pathway pseudopilin PulG